ncbi:aklavinone 12-hydroxylase RdmE [Actinosynnema sp. NPDC047251]|uniref:FAD dependent oxidoreductase n=1 Tax=Saccharothrix espanaensis (strain ATCC 51144 / DSM 44229 / JCM 9112 / NBRC 15066 / NRRL 15764) TaxID=1179773 RepID=K0KB30_SACES|nr:FAD-dependent monooxygenase [Saccharothrix espanaensis]CCH34737.1 FAD dependent oxidoreductase [Saccharothrix espanaensis DSM 44229]
MRGDTNVQVLVAGAGLAGATAALFLARQGIDVLAIAKHTGTSPHPRATGQTNRVMEIYRRAGVADEVLRGSEGVSSGIVIKVAESLRGRVFHTIVHEDDEQDTGLSPEPFGMSSQDHVEPVLVAKAREHGADIRFGTELTSFTQDEDGVTARLRDRASGEEYAVRADYLIGADGPRSFVRESLGIKRRGPGELSHHVGVVFDADLAEHLAADKGTLFYLRNPAFTGAFIGTNTARRNVFTVEYDPARGESLADFPAERCVELLRVATDLPDLEPDIVDITAWEMAAWLADSFRAGRVFLAGDAAKVTPPTGGMGGNTAVGDGFDLAWKLAAVLQGRAGPGLLDSYEEERRPYAQRIIDASFHNYVQRLAPHLAGPDVPEALDHLRLIFGLRCTSNAVVLDDRADPENSENSADPADPENSADSVEDPLDPTGRPGFRAPHVVVRHEGTPTSTISLFTDWTLVTLNPAWSAAPVHVPELTDDTGELARRYGIGDTGASLVRPDGVIAWRSTALPPDPAATVAAVLDAVLSRHPATTH